MRQRVAKRCGGWRDSMLLGMVTRLPRRGAQYPADPVDLVGHPVVAGRITLSADALAPGRGSAGQGLSWIACVDTRHLQQLVLGEVQTRKEVVAEHSSIVYEQVRKDALRPPDPVRTPSLITPRAQARRPRP
jgi:hypothetical protein